MGSDPVLDALGQASACRDLPGCSVGQLTTLQIYLDFAAPQMPADELFGQRILDVTLDGAAERARSVRTILAGEIDDPVDDFRQERNIQLTADQTVVQLVNQQHHEAPQLFVAARLGYDD